MPIALRLGVPEHSALTSAGVATPARIGFPHGDMQTSSSNDSEDPR